MSEHVSVVLRVEGLNLSNFVFDTQDLSTVRGGSFLLLEAIEDIERWFSLEDNRIASGASVGMYAVEGTTDIVGKLPAQILERLSKDKAYGHSTFAVDIADGTDEQNARERALALNRWRQMQSLRVVLPDPADVIGICEIDKVRPAHIRCNYKDQKDVPISISVDTRRSHGRDRKRNHHVRITKMAAPQPSTPEMDFVNDLGALSNDPTRGNLHHKMAVIYADGNGFQTIQRRYCRRHDDLRRFDRLVKKRRAEFLHQLLKVMQARPDGWVTKCSEDSDLELDSPSLRGVRYRLETLLWGGDEVTLIVPAWKGLELVRMFVQHPDDWRFDDIPLTHSIGLVFCHHNAPIHRVTALAAELATEAKKRNLDRSLEEYGSWLAYQVLESFDHLGRHVSDQFNQVTSAYGLEPNSLILDCHGFRFEASSFCPSEVLGRIPKRKLLRVLHLRRSQLADPSGANSCMAQESVQLEAQIESLMSDKERQSLRVIFGQGTARWYHITQLWDYLNAWCVEDYRELPDASL